MHASTKNSTKTGQAEHYSHLVKLTIKRINANLFNQEPALAVA